jgi:hypothetical protein
MRYNTTTLSLRSPPNESRSSATAARASARAASPPPAPASSRRFATRIICQSESIHNRLHAPRQRSLARFRTHFVHVVDYGLAALDVLQPQLCLHALLQYVSLAVVVGGDNQRLFRSNQSGKKTNQHTAWRMDAVGRRPCTQRIGSRRQIALRLRQRLLHIDPSITSLTERNNTTWSPTSCSCASAND